MVFGYRSATALTQPNDDLPLLVWDQKLQDVTELARRKAIQTEDVERLEHHLWPIVRNRLKEVLGWSNTELLKWMIDTSLTFMQRYHMEYIPHRAPPCGPAVERPPMTREQLCEELMFWVIWYIAHRPHMQDHYYRYMVARAKLCKVTPTMVAEHAALYTDSRTLSWLNSGPRGLDWDFGFSTSSSTCLGPCPAPPPTRCSNTAPGTPTSTPSSSSSSSPCPSPPSSLASSISSASTITNNGEEPTPPYVDLHVEACRLQIRLVPEALMTAMRVAGVVDVRAPEEREKTSPFRAMTRPGTVSANVRDSYTPLSY